MINSSNIVFKIDFFYLFIEAYFKPIITILYVDNHNT